MRIWKSGERVRITLEGRCAPGIVVMASENGRSLMLAFDAILGGYVGIMPVLDANDDGVFTDLMDGRIVTIEEATEEAAD